MLDPIFDSDLWPPNICVDSFWNRTGSLYTFHLMLCLWQLWLWSYLFSILLSGLKISLTTILSNYSFWLFNLKCKQSKTNFTILINDTLLSNNLQGFIYVLWSAGSSRVMPRLSTFCCLYYKKKVWLHHIGKTIKADVVVLKVKSGCI